MNRLSNTISLGVISLALCVGIIGICFFWQNDEQAFIGDAVLFKESISLPLREKENRLFLNRLKDEIATKRIVLIGETLHEDGTSVSIKSNLVQYLHDSLNFNLLVFESGTMDIFQLQQAFSDGLTEIKQSDYIWPFWGKSCQSQELWQYIKQCKGQLRIAGIDCQPLGNTKNDSLYYSFVSEILLEKGINVKEYPLFTKYIPSISRYHPEYQKRSSVDSLASEIESVKSLIHEWSNLWTYLDGIQNYIQYSSLYPKAFINERVQWRDSVMFNNFKRCFDPNEDKVVVWCSNMHAAKGFPMGNQLIPNLGKRISSEYGDDVYVILFDNYSRHNLGQDGSPYYIGKHSSVEHVIHSSIHNEASDDYWYFYKLDPFGDNVFSRLFEEERKLRVKTLADAIIYVDSMENIRYE